MKNCILDETEFLNKVNEIKTTISALYKKTKFSDAILKKKRLRTFIIRTKNTYYIKYIIWLLRPFEWF
jgi:hypothetical protein